MIPAPAVHGRPLRAVSDTLPACSKGAVSVIFATAIVPLLMVVGLAIDYGFYNEAEAQLDMAADAAAIHAARIASELLQQNGPASLSLDLKQGQTAGAAWFKDQVGVVPQSKVLNSPEVTLTADATGKSITAVVNYSGIIVAHFGNLFPGNWPYWPNWGIAGSATAVVTIPSHVEVVMLLDNSSSMLIAADPANIELMQALTPCSQQAATEGQTIDYDYSWAYTRISTGWQWGPNQAPPPLNSAQSPQASSNPLFNVPYGYGVFVYPITGAGTGNITSAQLTYVQDVLPKATPQVGLCDQRFVNAASNSADSNASLECQYPGKFLATKLLPAGTSVPTTGPNAGKCTFNGTVSGGGPASILFWNNNPNSPTPAALQGPNGLPQNTPQAPCAFACHSSAANNDYWGLAKANGVTTRYDVLHSAASDVISTLTSDSSYNLLTLGIYQFNAPGTASATDPGVSKVFPTGTQEASSDFADAAIAVNPTNLPPPVTGDHADTNFEDAMAYLDDNLGKPGNGDTAAAPEKDLFIVTDGMDDFGPDTNRIEQPISPAACQQLKTEGFTIYVLYTQYYPVPNPFYLGGNLLTDSEEIGGAPSPIESAMMACASHPVAPYYFEANTQADIEKALAAMLSSALGSPGRLSN